MPLRMLIERPVHLHQSDELDKKSKDVSAIVEITLPLNADESSSDGVEIVRLFLPHVPDISGLQYDADRDSIHAISDTTNTLLTFSRTGERLGSWILPGENQEGIAIHVDGSLFIVQDSGGGIRCFLDWDAMNQAPSWIRADH